MPGPVNLQFVLPGRASLFGELTTEGAETDADVGYPLPRGPEEPRDLPPGVIPVDGVGDLEQARPAHAPGDQDHRVGAARDHLGQKRDGRIARERRQDAYLVQEAPRGRRGRPQGLRDGGR